MLERSKLLLIAVIWLLIEACFVWHSTISQKSDVGVATWTTTSTWAVQHVQSDVEPDDAAPTQTLQSQDIRRMSHVRGVRRIGASICK